MWSGSSQHARDFERSAARVSRRWALVICSLFSLGVVLPWPTDAWVFGDNPDFVWALSVWRAAVAGLSVVGLLVAWRQWDRLGVPTLVVVMVGSGLTFACGWLFGQAPDPGEWFSYALPIPLMLVPFFMPLAARLLVTTTVVGGLWAGFAVSAESLAPLSAPTLMNLFSLSVLSVVAGEAFRAAVQKNFTARIELQDRAEALETLVAERTRRLRELASHLEATRESERRNVARELHDDTSQLLTAMRLELASVSPASDSDRERLAHLEELIAQMQNAQRRLIASLRPRALDDGSLGHAVRKHTRDFARRWSGEAQCTVEPSDLRAAPEVATVAFRVVQEALTNVARHAEAEHVWVDVRGNREHIAVEVRDDGRGFAPGENEVGFGLLAMRERIEMFGGTLEISPGEERGCQLLVTLPHSTDASAHGTSGAVAELD